MIGLTVYYKNDFLQKWAFLDKGQKRVILAIQPHDSFEVEVAIYNLETKQRENHLSTSKYKRPTWESILSEYRNKYEEILCVKREGNCFTRSSKRLLSCFREKIKKKLA